MNIKFVRFIVCHKLISSSDPQITDIRFNLLNIRRDSARGIYGRIRHIRSNVYFDVDLQGLENELICDRGHQGQYFDDSSVIQLLDNDMNSFTFRNFGGYRCVVGTGFGTIGFGITSPFANRFGGLFLSLDDQDGRMRLIASPTDVSSQYCYEGTIAYTPIVSEHYIQFRSRIALMWSRGDSIPERQVFAESSDVLTFEPELSESLLVPLDIRNGLDEFIMGQWNVSPLEFEMYTDCAYYVDDLPSLEFTIVGNSDDEVAVRIVLRPDDYVTIDTNSDIRRCRINVQAFDERDLTIGYPFLNVVGMHVDYSQHRIGFCEPL